MGKEANVRQGLELTIKTLQAKVRKLQKELREYKATFDLQYKRMSAATEAWRKATGETEVIPDLGTLLQWLFDKYQMSVEQQHTIDILRQQLHPVEKEREPMLEEDYGSATEVVETEEEDPNLPTKEEFDAREKESKGA